MSDTQTKAVTQSRAPLTDGRSRPLSRATVAADRCNVEGGHLNARCRIPGSPFSPGLVLASNAPGYEPVTVRFGPLQLPVGEDIDTFSFIYGSDGLGKHTGKLNAEIQVLTGSGWCLAQSRGLLACGEEQASTLSFDARGASRVYLSFAVSLLHDDDPADRAHVDFRSVLGYHMNPLVELLNSAGSDKGTDHYAGNGVPHAYALDYYRLFNPFRQEEFNLLEIGLAVPAKTDGAARDAPSLRAWRQFFPNAMLYGYDIEDFSWFSQPGTTTFQGDQSSRETLSRFIESADSPRFGLVVDDGSHASSHQQVSLAALFPYVEPGGMYVIEDLHWQPFEESPTTNEVLRSFVDRGAFESPFVRDDEARYLTSAIDHVTFFRPNDSAFAVLVKKVGGLEGSPDLRVNDHERTDS